MHPTTSDMRRAACEAVVTTIMGRDAAWKAWLAGELEVLPFERMNDDALLDFAEQVCPEKVPDLRKLPTNRYEVRTLVLCPVCMDAKHVQQDDGRYHRCPRCNALEPVEPT
jgi:hypothetical protein